MHTFMASLQNPMTNFAMRYTAPGYVYGPEYNSDFDPLEIKSQVWRVETPPTFEEPLKPYKFQKPVTVTHIFDEL